MNVERINNTVGIPEDRQGKVRSWAEMSYLIDSMFKDNINPASLKFARSYFRAQKLIAEERKVKARRVFRSLDKINGFQEFEDSNPFLLKTIDIAVRGRSHQNNSNP